MNQVSRLRGVTIKCNIVAILSRSTVCGRWSRKKSIVIRHKIILKFLIKVVFILYFTVYFIYFHVEYIPQLGQTWKFNYQSLRTCDQFKWNIVCGAVLLGGIWLSAGLGQRHLRTNSGQTQPQKHEARPTHFVFVRVQFYIWKNEDTNQIYVLYKWTIVSLLTSIFSVLVSWL